jgi:hypothetical protein
MCRFDADVRELQAKKNELESYIYSSKDKLFDNKNIKKTTLESEREATTLVLSEVENWFNDEGYTANLETIKEKWGFLHSF